MSVNNVREMCLLSQQTQTTNGTGPAINLLQGYQAAIVQVNCTTASGTSPTLNVFIQNGLRQVTSADSTGQDIQGGTIVWDDLLAFSTVSGAATRIFRIVTQGGPVTAPAVAGVEYALATGSLTATNVRPGPLGGVWRVGWTIGGTSPSFTFSVGVQLLTYANG